MRQFFVRKTSLLSVGALVLSLCAGCTNAPDVIQPKPGGAGGASAGAGGKSGAGAGQGGAAAGASGEDALDGGSDQAADAGS